MSNRRPGGGVPPRPGLRGLRSNRGLSATVVLTMNIDQLEDAAGVATTATGGTVPLRDALGMATDDYPVLCLFDRDGQLLYLGRGARLASPVQRLALYARDKGCTRPGCDLPAQWCQVHHLDEYQMTGPPSPAPSASGGGRCTSDEVDQPNRPPVAQESV